MNFQTKIIIVAILIVVFLLPNFRSFAEENLEEICQWEKIKEKPENLSEDDYESLLRKCQVYYQEKSEEIEGDITKTKQEKNTLQNKIYILKNKIKSLDYQIYQGNIMIGDLGTQIKDTGLSINKTDLEIENIKQNLANILQLRYEEDQVSQLEILLREENLSDFFDNLMALEALNLETQDLLKNIKNLKSSLETQKQSMDEEKDDLENIVTIQLLQKQESAKTKDEQEYYLGLTEQQYQKQLKEKQETEKKAAEIEARIFDLIGIPEAPTFGEALELAKYVEGITGVRPALLLAVLTQESNIGKNVGQCYLKNSSTGAGVVAFSGTKISRVMKPTRDVKPFLSITKELNRDPYNTLVSCPMSYGWGGAMGPAQFIPSTWILYRGKVKEITAKPADPWDIKDAFLAAALYLKDYGAGKQTYASEFNAVLSYFAGPSWYKSYYKNIYRRDYGYPVMGLVSGYEKDIQAVESAK